MRPRFFGDRRTGQHSGDFFAPFIGTEFADAGARSVWPVALLYPVMVRRARGDLRRMGHYEHLRALRKTREPFADGACDRATHAAVDLVEDHRRRAARLGK